MGIKNLDEKKFLIEKFDVSASSFLFRFTKFYNINKLKPWLIRRLGNKCYETNIKVFKKAEDELNS